MDSITRRGPAHVVLGLCLVAGAARVPAGDLFVCAETGDDKGAGTTRTQPLRTVETAMERVETGGVIILLTGWHEGGIALKPGEPGRPITLRGDRAGRVFIGQPSDVVSGWSPVDGFEYTFATPAEVEPKTLLESSTGTQLRPMPSPADVESLAGTFHFCGEEQRLYLHPSDSESADRHLYTRPSPHGTGITLADHVVIEDLVITGMGEAAMLGREVRDVVIRRCRAYRNGYALRLHGVEDVRVHDNHFWSNIPALRSQVYVGSGPGDSVNRRIVFENNLVHDSPMASIRFYSTGPLEDGIMRGNIIGSSYSKGVPDGSLLGERNVALNWFWTHRGGHNTYLSSPHAARIKETDLVMLRPGDAFRGEAFAEVDHPVANETWRFADPAHLDFRLQSDSPARGAAPDGSDLGAFQYDGSVVYVSPDGDDEAAGTSERTAWRTLAHAVSAITPGQTLYIAPGEWDEPLILNGLISTADTTTRIRAHGKRAVYVPTMNIDDCEALEVSGIHARGPAAHIRVRASVELDLQRCSVHRTAAGNDDPLSPGIEIVDSRAVRIEHAAVTGAAKTGVRIADSHDVELVSSVLAAMTGPQIELAGDTREFWSAFNGFVDTGRPAAVFVRTGEAEVGSLEEWRELGGLEYGSRIISAKDFESPADGNMDLVAGRPASYTGRYDKPIGPGRVLRPERQRPPVERVEVVSTTRTSANLTWWTPGRITGTIVEWGRTPDYGERYDRTDYARGEHETFHDASLIGLEPETTYHFRVGFRDHRGREERIESPLIWSGDYTFTTAARDPVPRQLHVAPDGDDAADGRTQDTAWRTLAHAAREARAGDTVTLAPGRYLELLRPLQTGTGEDRRITFRAEKPLTVFLDGGFVRDGTGRSHCAQIMGKAYITLENLVFERARRDDNGGYRGFPGHAGLVRVSGSSGIRIEACVMDGRRRYMVGLMGEGLGAISGAPEEETPIEIVDSLFVGNWYALLLAGRGTAVMRNNALVRNMVFMAAFRMPTVLRNNIYQSLISNKWGSRLFVGVDAMDSDFNGFGWDDDNTLRRIAYISRRDGTFVSGLSEWQSHFGKDGNSIEAEPGYGLSAKLGFGTHGRIGPVQSLSIEDLILPADSPYRGAGEDGENIGPRWERFQ